MPLMMYDYDSIQSEDWGWGVFYAWDSNSVDSRCHWDGSAWWDCPGWKGDRDGNFYQDKTSLGSGFYDPGSPFASFPGGGAGCHFDGSHGAIDQPDAWAADFGNLVQTEWCMCSDTYKGKWDQWVDNFVKGAVQKFGFEQRGWFGAGKAPAWGMDAAICWNDNPRDMIELQNQIYWKANEWNNQLSPASTWAANDDAQNRRYWGWNEVPVSRGAMIDPMNWDSIIIKLPAHVCQGISEWDDEG